MTGELETSMLASMREAIRSLLPDLCDILTVSRIPDGMGGEVETWVTTGSRIPFRLDMSSGSEMTSGGALQPVTRYKGSLPYDAEISPSDRISHNGHIYAVTSINDDQSWSAVVRVDLERIP